MNIGGHIESIAQKGSKSNINENNLVAFPYGSA
jgi:hypothetical protein